MGASLFVATCKVVKVNREMIQFISWKACLSSKTLRPLLLLRLLYSYYYHIVIWYSKWLDYVADFVHYVTF